MDMMRRNVNARWHLQDPLQGSLDPLGLNQRLPGALVTKNALCRIVTKKRAQGTVRRGGGGEWSEGLSGYLEVLGRLFLLHEPRHIARWPMNRATRHSRR